MAIEFVAQRLEIGDVVVIALPEEEGEVQATVVRDVDRTDTTVRATLRVADAKTSSRSGLSASLSPSSAVLERDRRS
jgi:hypothetical protein